MFWFAIYQHATSFFILFLPESVSVGLRKFQEAPELSLTLPSKLTVHIRFVQIHSVLC
jgi:hypothetical protein